jgi:CBS domain-containing protein
LLTLPERIFMRARDLAEPFPVVHPDTDALTATRLLVDQGLPGLIVTDQDGKPLVILPGSQVLRFALPDYVEEDPALAGVIPESEADRFCETLSGRTVAELMPGKEFLPRRDRDRPIVSPEATVLEVASVMSRQKSPVVAVVDGDGTDVLGVITVHRLVGALLPRS